MLKQLPGAAAAEFPNRLTCMSSVYQLKLVLQLSFYPLFLSYLFSLPQTLTLVPGTHN